jgi:hypothetical protein
MVVRNKKLNEKGQAFLELIFFMPIMLMLLAALVVFGNSINGSINQQKVVRSYFYARLKNNSTMPRKRYNAPQDGWRQFGMYFIGWKEKFEGGENGNLPLKPCYKVPIGLDEQECKAFESESTKFIRLGTVYGLCGATYLRTGGRLQRAPSSLDGSSESAHVQRSSCTIIE